MSNPNGLLGQKIMSLSVADKG